MVRHYRPPFDKQLTGSLCGKANCNMCAAGRFANRQTLGALNYTGDEMRTLSGTAWKCADADPKNDGTNLKDAAVALSKLATPIVIRDDITWSEVITGLDKVGFICHGDYDRVPIGLRGDREFLGLHSVFFNERDAVGGKGILVYDSLDDARADLPTGHPAPQGPIWWPESVAKAYAEAFPGPNITGAFGRLRRVRPVVPVANIRSGPTRKRPVIARAISSHHDVNEWGVLVHGERIGRNDVWYRVWVPELRRIGFMHDSVVDQIPTVSF